jgi:hypothetical protein
MSDKMARSLSEIVGLDLVVAMGLADEDEQTFVSDEWVWHRAMEYQQMFLIANTLLDVESKRRAAADQIGRVQDEAERAQRAILKGQGVNSLGVFQNSAGQADVAVAVYMQEAQFLSKLCNSYRRELQAAQS